MPASIVHMPTPPGTIIGYRADGSPVYPLAGGRQQPGEPGAAGAPATGDAERGPGPVLTHSQSVNRLRDIQTQMTALAALTAPSAEDDAYFRELEREFDEVDGHRLNLERQATLARVSSATSTLNVAGYLRAERGSGGHDAGHGYDRDSIMEPDSIEEARFRSPWKIDEMRTLGRPPEQVAAEFRARALSAVAQMPGANDKIRAAGTAILERWDDQDANLSQLTLALSSPAYLRAWSKLARTDGAAAELDTDERQALAHVRHTARATRAMSLTDAAGGYLVPFQLDPTVIITANGSVNQIRQVARQVVAIGDTWNGVSAGAVSWSYDAEAAEVSDDSPTFGQVSIPIYKAQGFVPISVEAIQDAANVAAEVGNLLAFGRDVLEANAFAVGTGVAMPTGIITALTGSSSVVPSTTTDVLAVGDIYKLQAALPARYRNQPSTAWLGNNLIYNMVRQFGTDLWGTLTDGRPAGLLGRPVLESEDMDGTITPTVDNNVLVHGDFSNFIIADRVGMTVEFVPHLFGANRRPTGQRGWLAYVRHGSDSINDAAFRMLNVT